VYKAKEKETGEIVALKKVRMDNEKEGFPITAIREIKILKEMRNDHIIRLKEIVVSRATDYNKGKGSIYLVMDFMDHDLTGLMNKHLRWFSEAQIKCYMQQLLEGLHYCHRNNILHRDVKASNLLVNNEGILKLADFGLARPWTPEETNYTNRVITLWFRPPELLLGATQYGPAIDMWSAGCILGEMLAKRPLFPGRKEFEQLEMIWQVCGSPTKENWPDVSNESKYPLFKMFRPDKPHQRVLREKFHSFPKSALDLLDRLLTLDPTKRATAEEALDSDYFWTEPLPCQPEELPKYPSANEFSTKKRPPPQQEHEAKRQRVPDGRPPFLNPHGGPPQHHGQRPQGLPAGPGQARPPGPPHNLPPQQRPPQQIPKGPPR